MKIHLQRRTIGSAGALAGAFRIFHPLRLECASTNAPARAPVLPARAMLAMSAFMAIAALAESLAVAQDVQVAGHFPGAGQVAADFPDEPTRYVVLTLLWDALHEKAPGATTRRSEYYRAAEAIRQKYMVRGNAAYAAFDKRTLLLTASPEFRRSVLEKYQLASLPVERQAAPPRAGYPTGAEVKAAFLRAAPFMAAGVLVMIPLARVLVRRASVRSAVRPTSRPGRVDDHGAGEGDRPGSSAASRACWQGGPAPVSPPGNWPALPESLRVVSLPALTTRSSGSPALPSTRRRRCIRALSPPPRPAKSIPSATRSIPHPAKPP